MQLSVVHVRDVFVSWGVVVVALDDFVEHRSKGVEALVAASINTDARVGPFSTREDALLEGVAIFVFTVLASIPDVTSENLGEERRGS